jgi:RNase P protein component
MRPGGLQTELMYETTISTIEGPAETAARLSGPQLEQERARHFGQSPPGRSQAFNARIAGRRMVASTPQRWPFGRAARIKQGRDFARVRRAGERLVLGCLIANWQRLPVSAASRLGMRESFRLHQHELAGPVDLVLVGRPSIAGKGFAQVERDFLTTLRKARLLKPVGERNA